MSGWAQAAAAAVASGQRFTVEGPTWWALVWCHEIGHYDVRPMRDILARAAMEAGAELKCLKKGAKFDIWISTPQQPPFVLLADWREIKPCIKIIDKQPDGIRPLFTVVLAEDEKLFRRSSNWVSNLPERPDPVHVCKDIGLAWLFIIEQMTKVCAEREAGGWESVAPIKPPMPADRLLNKGRKVPDEPASESSEEGPEERAAESQEEEESKEGAPSAPAAGSNEQVPRAPKKPAAVSNEEEEQAQEEQQQASREPAQQTEAEEAPRGSALEGASAMLRGPRPDGELPQPQRLLQKLLQA